MSTPEIIRLLEKYFPPEDWRYLCQCQPFRDHLAAKHETLEDYEELAKIGLLLIRQRDELKSEVKRA